MEVVQQEDLSQLRVYKVTLVEEQIGMQPASQWLVVETFTGGRRRFVSVMQASGDVNWQEQTVNGPSRGRVLSQAVCTDTGLKLCHLQLQSGNPQYALAAFRRAAMPETFGAKRPRYLEPPHLLAPGPRALPAATILNGCILIPNVMDGEECMALRQRLEGSLEPDRVGAYDDQYQKLSRYNFRDRSMADELFLRIHSAIKDLEVVIDAEGACQLSNGEFGEAVDVCPDEFRLASWRDGEFGDLEGVWRVKGLHEYLRFLKYEQGGFLAKHCDAMYTKSEHERTFFTVLLYINGGLEGGSTQFLKMGHNAAINGSGPFEAAREDEVACTVSPEVGSCLIFFQPGLLHAGEALESDEKYVLRSDVMFERIREAEAPAAQVSGGPRLAARSAEAAGEGASPVEDADKLDAFLELFG